MSDYFSARGNSDLGNYFKGFAQGGHGSGFALQVQPGLVVVVTNRHVAGNASHVNLSIDGENGAKKSFTRARVVYVDPLVDLALVELPSDAAIPVLKLADQLPTDGTEVWSAGFPGFMNKPAWQLSKGNVTNRNIEVDNFGPAGENLFLQHSASIDPGNSGGPLLIGDIAKPDSLRVVGVNTLTATQRNNTFFAVPASKVQQALNRFRVQLKAESDPGLGVKIAGDRFITYLKSAAWDQFAWTSLIATAAASPETWQDFLAATRTMSTKDRDAWLTELYWRPVDTLRKYLSWKIWNLANEGSEPPSIALDGSTLSIIKGQGGWKGDFTLEAGQWLLSAWSLNEKAKELKKVDEQKVVAANTAINVGGITPVGFSLLGGITIPIPDAAKADLGFALGIGGSSQIAEGFTSDFAFLVATQYFRSNEMVLGTDWGSVIRRASTSYLSGRLAWGFQWFLPFYNREMYFAPWLGARANLGINTSIVDIGSSWSMFPDKFSLFDVGLSPRLGFEYSPNRSWALGIEASMDWNLLGLSGIRSIPLMLYYKAVTIY